MKSSQDISDFGGDSIALGSAAAASFRARAVDYYELTKPRMNFLVVVTTMVGFYMAAEMYSWPLLLATLFGTAMTAASASVFNQLIEREYDALMPRTRNRPLPGERVTPAETVVWGLLLGTAGVGILLLWVNLLTATLGLLTLLLYVFVYTPMKRTSSLCTIVGAIPGAIPPMMGWTAYQNTLSVEAMILFGILFIWQMPHFLAIAVLFKDDYCKGGFQMLPCVDDERLSITTRQTLIYLIAMLPMSFAPWWFGMSGAIYLAAAVVLGVIYFGYGVRLAQTRARIDARKLFFVSIIYLPLLLAVMMLDVVSRG